MKLCRYCFADADIGEGHQPGCGRNASASPILPKPGTEPLGVLRSIAYDLINNGTSNEDRRAGRRILGAIAALDKLEKANGEGKPS